MASAQDSGIIGRTYEDGAPVILKLVDEFPDEATRARFPWLMVISWRFDGSSNNGMPSEDLNQSMISLEKEIESSLQAKDMCRHAYSRTGNGLKELVYYIPNRDSFMAAFNEALSDHPRYPIGIQFYEDAQWEDFGKLLEAFRSGE